MKRWLRDFLICLLLGSILAGFFVLIKGKDIFTKDNYLILGIIIVVAVVLYAFDLFVAAHFYTTIRRKIGFINFIAVAVVLVTILMFLVHRCTPLNSEGAQEKKVVPMTG
ncbi:MAG: hypothetical protein PVJ01_04475, partial [Pseudomonadota bacterium]